MKKFVMALAALALVSGTAAAQAAPKKNMDLACMQNLVSKRDTAILGAYNTESQTISKAFSTRLAALKSAWSLTDRGQRKAAINTAWKNFRQTTLDAKKAYRGTRNEAWQTFNSSKTSCRLAKDDVTDPKVDANL